MASRWYRTGHFLLANGIFSLEFRLPSDVTSGDCPKSRATVLPKDDGFIQSDSRPLRREGKTRACHRFAGRATADGGVLANAAQACQAPGPQIHEPIRAPGSFRTDA